MPTNVALTHDGLSGNQNNLQNIMARNNLMNGRYSTEGSNSGSKTDNVVPESRVRLSLGN
jgi:hypothetical protein